LPGFRFTTVNPST